MPVDFLVNEIVDKLVLENFELKNQKIQKPKDKEETNLILEITELEKKLNKFINTMENGINDYSDELSRLIQIQTELPMWNY